MSIISRQPIRSIVVMAILITLKSSTALTAEGAFLGPPMGSRYWRLTLDLHSGGCSKVFMGEFVQHAPIAVGFLKLPEVNEGAVTYISFVKDTDQRAPIDVVFSIGERVKLKSTKDGESLRSQKIHPVSIASISFKGNYRRLSGISTLPQWQESLCTGFNFRGRS